MNADVIDLAAARYARDAKAAVATACKCGAMPGPAGPMCREAARQGRERGDYAADCKRWQRAANAAALVHTLENSGQEAGPEDGPLPEGAA